MKLFRLTALSFIFTTFFALAAFAQTGGGKIAVINTGSFDSKTGIVKYFNAMESVDKEFAAVTTQLQTLAVKYETLRKEITTLQDQAQKIRLFRSIRIRSVLKLMNTKNSVVK